MTWRETECGNAGSHGSFSLLGCEAPSGPHAEVLACTCASASTPGTV